MTQNKSFKCNILDKTLRSKDSFYGYITQYLKQKQGKIVFRAMLTACTSQYVPSKISLEINTVRIAENFGRIQN